MAIGCKIFLGKFNKNQVYLYSIKSKHAIFKLKQNSRILDQQDNPRVRQY